MPRPLNPMPPRNISHAANAAGQPGPDGTPPPWSPTDWVQGVRQLFQDAPQLAVQGYDRDRRVIFWNAASELLYGYTASEAIGQRLEDLIIPPTMRTEVVAAIHNWLENGQTIPAGELSLQRKDGQIVQVFSSHTLLHNPQGQPELYCVDLDLTELRSTHEALQTTQAQYRQTVDHSLNPIFSVDRAGQIQTWNPACTQVLQYSAAIIGQKVDCLLPTATAQTFLHHAIQQVWAGEVFAKLELTYRAQDGTLRHTLSRLYPIHDRDGGVMSCVIANTDITDRKQAEAALATSVQQLQLLIDNIDIGIVLHGQDTEILQFNQTALDLLDVTAEELRGLDGQRDVMYADGTPCPGIDHPLRQAILHKQPIKEVVMGVYRPSRGDRVWLSANATPILDQQGAVQRVICGFHDITATRLAEQELRAEQELLSSVMSTSVAAITVLDPLGQIIFANQSAKQILGLTPSELAQRTYNAPEWRATSLDGSPWPDEQQPFYQVLTTGNPVTDVRHAIEWPDGRRRALSINGAPIKDEAGTVQQLVFSVNDISDRLAAEQALQESEARFRLLAENMSDLVCLHDSTGRYQYVSPSSMALLGFEPSALVNRHPREFCHPQDDESLEAAFAKLAHPTAPLPDHETPAIAPFQLGCPGMAIAAVQVNGDAPAAITYRMRDHAGQYHWMETLMRPICDAEGRLIQIQTTSRDVSEKIAMQQQLRHEALHDALTGLPNRHCLMEYLDRQLQTLQQAPDRSFALLFLDLDRFKVVNDSLGHLSGDQVLVETADRLQGCLPPDSFIARFGGDEFVVVLNDIPDLAAVCGIAEQLLNQVRLPILLENREMVTAASIGIVMSDHPQVSAVDLLRNADIAMYQAKANGRSRYELFTPQMYAALVLQLQIEHDLRKALARQEFQLVYQPIVNLKTHQLLGFEVLIRWHHPTLGFIAPGQFIAIAEETGLIVPIGAWVLTTACRQLATWQAEYAQARHIKISVNLAVPQLHHPDLLTHIDTALATSGLAGHHLTLEITEGMLVDTVDDNCNLLHEIKQRGSQISIDDFGTGYSSLSYLHRLPIDLLKVDRSFIQRMSESRRNFNITQTIIALAHQLGIAAIAEGIETVDQLEQLATLGCDYGQGFWFAKPLPPEAIPDWLETWQSASHLQSYRP